MGILRSGKGKQMSFAPESTVRAAAFHLPLPFQEHDFVSCTVKFGGLFTPVHLRLELVMVCETKT
jgi:hypothetical protein